MVKFNGARSIGFASKGKNNPFFFGFLKNGGDTRILNICFYIIYVFRIAAMVDMAYPLL